MTPFIADHSEFRRLLAATIPAVEGYHARYPDERFIHSILLQLRFLDENATVEAPLISRKDELNFGTMAGRAFSGLDDKLEDDLHLLSNYVRDRL